jgi:DNA-binding response OmpR family regulator
MRRPGVVFTREQLLSDVWGYAATAGGRTVDVHVAQVRAKLGGASPIRTVRSVGYAAARAPHEGAAPAADEAREHGPRP